MSNWDGNFFAAEPLPRDEWVPTVVAESLATVDRLNAVIHSLDLRLVAVRNAVRRHRDWIGESAELGDRELYEAVGI